jgi:hypothetical protein
MHHGEGRGRRYWNESLHFYDLGIIFQMVEKQSF